MTRLCVEVFEREAVRRAQRRRGLTLGRPKGLKGRTTLDPSGYDAGRKIKGLKRRILVDTLNLLLNVVLL